jgi:hypothetical protein
MNLPFIFSHREIIGDFRLAEVFKFGSIGRNYPQIKLLRRIILNLKKRHFATETALLLQACKLNDTPIACHDNLLRDSNYNWPGTKQPYAQ